MPTATPIAQASPRIAVIGAGAAGYFAAIACKRANPQAQVAIYERNERGLRKVLASGGGRCNLSHACFDPEELIKSYPRGARELLGPFYTFGPRQTLDWFTHEGLALKTQDDGRVFPATDRAGSVAYCLEKAARNCAINVRTRMALSEIAAQSNGGFKLWFNKGEFSEVADAVLLACGGMRDSSDIRRLTQSLGHSVLQPLPSLFAFKCQDMRLRNLAGVSVPRARLWIDGQNNPQSGALLITHHGFSGPAALKLSSWQARELFEKGYRFRLRVCWLDPLNEKTIGTQFENARRQFPKRRIAAHSPFETIPQRLWERLAQAANIGPETTWNTLSREKMQALARETCAGIYQIDGRAQNKDEFVTCGGVCLKEVHFKTMQSRIVPHLHFAGEILDIDAITGGYNLQAAWTTGWIAGNALAQTPFHESLR